MCDFKEPPRLKTPLPEDEGEENAEVASTQNKRKSRQDHGYLVRGEPRTSALVDRRPSPVGYTMYLPFRFFESLIQFMNYWIAAVEFVTLCPIRPLSPPPP